MSCRRRNELRDATSPAAALSRQQQSDATPRPLVLDFDRQYTVFTLVLSCSIPVPTTLASKRAESRIRALKATVHTENERSRGPPDLGLASTVCTTDCTTDCTVTVRGIASAVALASSL